MAQTRCSIVLALLLCLLTLDILGQFAHESTCHAVPLLSIAGETLSTDFEEAIRALPPEQSFAFHLLSAKDAASADVHLDIKSDALPAVDVLDRQAAKANLQIVRYRLIATRTSDQRSFQRTLTMLEGQWQPLARSIVAILSEICPSAAPAGPAHLYTLDSRLPLTSAEREALASADVFSVRSQDNAADSLAVVAALTAEANARRIGVDFVPDRLDQDPLDATIVVTRFDKGLWEVEISKGEQRTERQVVAIRVETAAAKIARAVVEVLCEANGVTKAISPPKQNATKPVDVSAKLIAGSFASHDDKLRLHLDQKSFVVYERDGTVVLTVLVGHILDVATDSPEFDYHGLDKLNCGGEDCVGLMLYEAAAIPVVVGMNLTRQHYFDIAWQDGNEIKTASFELRRAKKLERAVRPILPDQP